ncbi:MULTISPECIES: deoxyguanosinetriphosphate triphosphohydrolase [unclassified Rothia (in: high G+C Gram-positive bacteria)]|uniref:deoxyguanosinetriphosphate triphosphohydrolase n=1 Tax=unclassified Rothia (in: high G+C Gram-positive bacteria) TaxID=2689056 RepID=UPI0019571309|nr:MULTISPECIES: deoxyguanosinetriphosphate triphosphohydrolase [unclassified Rothia (in: high G+C Gram-positive bacteria)]MBM7051342.1 deoxyguanosinetriphosphate triphosphohydrolase [Rothia sp. ZJ1223]QRZ61137.1 deoxyguanosinetriphosphate triphosphohydrolase [Rothia sp. ZJ932]
MSFTSNHQPHAGQPPEIGSSTGYTEQDVQRWVPEHHRNVYRSAFERDRARILHSSALRRLGAKTQVLDPNTDDFVRTRLTHSLEVAQIGREIGRMLGCDPDLVDAACLSHDLGHPPFGHNGETALNELAQDAGGFEGNAQTLRLLTRLEPKVMRNDDGSAGLNLTRATLDASCKYPWTREAAPARTDGKPNRKFGAYADDMPVFEWFRSEAVAAGAAPTQKCMEAQVMDLADDISYSVHDVEDAVFGGHVQLHHLNDPAARERVFEKTRQWYLPNATDEQLNAALMRLENIDRWGTHMSGSRASMAGFKALTSDVIGRFAAAAVHATREKYGNDPLVRYNATLVVPLETEHEIAVMKGIATAYVMTTRDALPHYEQQRSVLGVLVTALFEDTSLLDRTFRADLVELGPNDDAARLRLVIDQVASLTDRSALDLFKQITTTGR